MENIPDAVQTIRATLTLPVCISTPVGLTNIPEPMIDPTITVTPFIKDIFASSFISSPSPPLSVVVTASYGLVSPFFTLPFVLPFRDMIPENAQIFYKIKINFIAIYIYVLRKIKNTKLFYNVFVVIRFKKLNDEYQPEKILEMLIVYDSFEI